MSKVKILTPKGTGEIENIYVSELNFLMLKINNLDGTYTTYNLGEHRVETNIFSNKLISYETTGSARSET
jgi:hypothetical protein